ncbi:MAG: hypothetical protein F9B45_30770 [Phycisphaera sp. RhM]|nr:hypothetical protein [Phycisphaera sp. RhM]
MARYEIDTVKQAAAGRWPEIFNAISRTGEESFNGQHGPCPKCGGTDRFRLIDDQAGACLCNQCFNTKNGDGIAALQWLTGDDFLTALEKIANYLGISPKKRKTSADPAEHLDFLPWNPTLVGLWCLKKKPITCEAVQAVGGCFAKYRGQYSVIAIPVWGSSLREDKPVGWVIYRSNGGELPKWSKGESEPGWVKVKLTAGSSQGVICGTNTFAGSETSLWKTEGPTDLMALISAQPTVAAFTTANGATEKPLDWILRLCDGKTVNVVHDADKPGQEGATEIPQREGRSRPGWCPRLATSAAAVRNVTLPFPIERTHGPDLRDYFNGGGTFQSLNARAAEAPTFEVKVDPRRVIEWSDNEKELVDSTIEALTQCDDIFQRGGELLDVTEARHPLSDKAHTLRVRRLPPAHLRTLVTSCAKFVVTNDEGETRPKKLPEVFTRQVDAYGTYPGIRELESVSEYPFLREDGSICSTNGYDSATRTYLKTNVAVDVPSAPSIHDATAAANRILELVADFEFKEVHHKSAWLAGLLTVFCKPAIRGCVPLFIADASVQGAGKTRLVDIISTIATGKSLARNPWPSKDEEIAKSITAITMSGIPLVLFDNCKTQIGGQAIEALGTAEVWKSRILGQSKESGEIPIRQVFFLTGNNCSVTLDVARRTCFVRLEPSVENPDTRSDFRFPDLLGHIADTRESLVRDVLIILRAFKISGESPSMQKWGGFENWSSLVRGAIIWLGLPDPFAGTLETKDAAQSDDLFGDLLTALVKAGVTESLSGEICRLAQERDVIGKLFHPALHDVLLSACGDKKLTPQRVGKILQRYDGRILNEKKFFSVMDEKLKQKKWVVQQIDCGNRQAWATTSPGVGSHRELRAS